MIIDSAKREYCRSVKFFQLFNFIVTKPNCCQLLPTVRKVLMVYYLRKLLTGALLPLLLLFENELLFVIVLLDG